MTWSSHGAFCGVIVCTLPFSWLCIKHTQQKRQLYTNDIIGSRKANGNLSCAKQIGFVTSFFHFFRIFSVIYSNIAITRSCRAFCICPHYRICLLLSFSSVSIYHIMWRLLIFHSPCYISPAFFRPFGSFVAYVYYKPVLLMLFSL